MPIKRLEEMTIRDDFMFYAVMQNEKICAGLITAVKGDSILVRIPIIPGYVDREGQLLAREKVMELGIKKFDLCKYKVNT